MKAQNNFLKNNSYKKLTIMLLSLFLFTILTKTAVAAEGQDGNGGGVICIAGKCQTLASAGLRISRNFGDMWIPKKDQVDAVKNYIEKSPFSYTVKGNLINKTLGTMTHFRAVNVFDPEKLMSLKNQYLKLLEANGFKTDPKTFNLVAISSDDTAPESLTYLLPDFFKLDSTVQAKILVHEGLYRNQPTQILEAILLLEGAMDDILLAEASQNNPNIEDRQKYINLNNAATVDALLAAYDLKLIDKKEFISVLLAFVSQRFTKIGTIEEKVDSSMNNTQHSSYIFNLDITKLVRANNFDPRIAVILSKIKFLPLEVVYNVGSTPWVNDWQLNNYQGPGKTQLTLSYCTAYSSTNPKACSAAQILGLANIDEIELVTR